MSMETVTGSWKVRNTRFDASRSGPAGRLGPQAGRFLVKVDGSFRGEAGAQLEGPGGWGADRWVGGRGRMPPLHTHTNSPPHPLHLLPHSPIAQATVGWEVGGGGSDSLPWQRYTSHASTKLMAGGGPGRADRLDLLRQLRLKSDADLAHCTRKRRPLLRVASSESSGRVVRVFGSRRPSPRVAARAQSPQTAARARQAPHVE